MISLTLILIIAVASTFLSFKATEDRLEYKYVSEGNDIARIVLEMYKNGQFCLKFQQVNSEKEKAWKGSWELNQDDFELKFRVLSKPNLEQLQYSSTGSKSDQISIEGSRKISINTKAEGVWIWGIYCSKK